MAMFIFQPSCLAFASHATAIFLATSSVRMGRCSNAMAEPASAVNSDAMPTESRVLFMGISLQKEFVKQRRGDFAYQNSAAAGLIRRLRKVPRRIRLFRGLDRDIRSEALHQRIRLRAADHAFAMRWPQESFGHGLVEHGQQAVVIA